MIRKLLENELPTKFKELANLESDICIRFINQLENNIVRNDYGIGLPYWAEQDPKFVMDITYALVETGFATVRVSRKYSRLEFNVSKIDKEALTAYRIRNKLRKFLMREDVKDYAPNMVKVLGKVKETGLVRQGFAKVAKNSFRYDIDALQRYYEPIKANLVKTITKAKEKGYIKEKYLVDEANYETIIKYCLDHYMIDNKYNLEANISDSRGRSIYKALKRIGNPITSKDFRALLVMPSIYVHRDNADQMNDIYYFIAELIGSKALTEADKIQDGIKYYSRYELPELELTTEHGQTDMHELIWLDRIYTKLDALYARKVPFIEWDIPLEVDASMSIAQVVGALTNESRLLERTNVIGSILSDPWFIEGVNRLTAKTVGTPTFYGSSQSATSLIRSKGLAINPDEIKAIRKEFSTGGLAIMKQFKDAIIKNYNVHAPIIPMKIWNDNFDVYVNKFKPAGAKLVVTEAWTGLGKGKGFKRSFTHQPVMVPDYSRMKLFWATCLIHNLDSQLVNKIPQQLPNDWMLTIHDAVIAGPGVCKRVRNQYAIGLKEVNKNRNIILNDFKRSIGATTVKADVAFYKLHEATQQAEDIAFNASAMK